MSKKTKIFLIIFSVFLLAITVASIIYKNSHKITDESHIIIESGQKIPEISDEDILRQNASTKETDLNETYAVNGLTYEYTTYTENDVNVDLLQISGLNNKEVEEGINTDLKERIKKILDSNNFKNNSDDSAHVTTSLTANFSDVISIKIDVKFSESFGKSYGLNYRLDNGERLKFSDLFIYNAPKKNIVSFSAYKTFAMNYYIDEGISNDFYSNIEGDVLEFLIDYNNDKITEFSFTPLTIELYREGKTVIVDMIDYYKYIDIFSKFVSTSDLYESTSKVPKKVPVFVQRPSALYDLYEKVNDTCILDVIIYTDEKLSENEMKTVDNYKKDLVERLSTVKSERGVYYSNYIKVTRGSENDEKILIFEESECFAASSENEFADKIYNIILSAERDKNNVLYGRSKIYFLDEDMLNFSIGTKKYSIKTTKELEEITDEEEEEEDDDNNEENQNNVSENTMNEVPNVSNEPQNVIEQPDVPAANITTEVIF